MNWDEYFMRMAYLASNKSKDPSTKIGAVVVKDRQVLATGYNGICRGVRDDIGSRYEPPKKYLYFEHGQRNCCYAAARKGISLEGATMYTMAYPCADCARAIIQSGITELVLHAQWEDKAVTAFKDGWGESQKVSDIMFFEAGVSIRMLEQELGLGTLIREGLCNV